MSPKYTQSTTSAGSIAVAILLCLCGMMFMLIQPIIVSGYVEIFGFSNDQAARIVSSNAAGQVFGAFLASSLLGRLNVRQAVRITASTLILLEMICATLSDATSLIILRLLCGTGLGLLLAFGTAIIAGMRNTERIYAGTTFSQVICSAIMVYVLALTILRVGVGTVHVPIILLSGICLMLSGNIPRHVVEKKKTGNGIYTKASLLALASHVFFFFAVAMLWTYLTQIGIAGGLTAQKAGEAFGIGGIWSLLVASFVLWLGARCNPLIPLLVGIASVLVSSAVLIGEIDYSLFLVGSALNVSAPLWFQTYILVVLAIFDRSGRLGAVAITLAMLCQVVSPLVTAMLVKDGDFDSPLLLSQALMVLSMTTIIWAFIASGKFGEQSE